LNNGNLEKAIKKEPDSHSTQANEDLIEAAFLATLKRMDEPEYVEFVADQLNAIRGYFMKAKGWFTSTSRDRVYFECGWSSGYSKCLFDIVKGKVDISTELKIQNDEVEEAQKGE